MEEKFTGIHSIFDKSRNLCFGRLIMRVPEGAIIAFGPTEVESTIEYLDREAVNIDKYIALRLREVEDEKKFFSGKDTARLPLFGKLIDGIKPFQKIVIGSDDRVGYTITSFLPVEEILYKQIVYGVLPEQDFIERMNRVAVNLRSRHLAEIPVEPGLCIQGGFVIGEYEYERATIGVRFEQYPDVHLSIDVHKNLKFLNNDSNPKMLHQRAKESAQAAGLGAVFARTRILRDQVRKIGHWSGQEMAFRTPAYKDAKSVHEIRFYSAGSVNDPFHPQLDIRLYSGVKDNQKASIEPSVTDEEVVALWDRLVSTIRLREPGDATPPKVARTPLATRAGTGNICPESGWWETREKHAENDRRRRFVRAGELMPSADTSTGNGAWQKIFGGNRHKISTTWTLVDYADDSVNTDPAATAAGPAVQIEGSGDKHA